jgi:hypothetical protein
MLLAATLALLAPGAPSPGGPALPASFRRDTLRACAPATLEAAQACIRASMSPEEFAILAERIPSRRFRGFIDCEIELAFRLGDATSPMGRLMDGLLGFHNPGFAASMIISDLQVRMAGGGGDAIPFEERRERFRTEPPPAGSGTTCTADTTPSA